MSKEIYREKCFIITQAEKNNKPLYWAYRLPYCENLKEFTSLEKAKKYIYDLLKEEN